MTITQEDLDSWEKLIQSVLPLKKGNKCVVSSPIERLKIKPKPVRILQHIVDLHGLTVQEAYECVFKFITVHYVLNSKTISIITGKGQTGEGKIKKEIEFWLETATFKEKISRYEWINDGGTIRIYLKKIKENKKTCQKK